MKKEILTFKIDGLTLETLPILRLAAYMIELAQLFLKRRASALRQGQKGKRRSPSMDRTSGGAESAFAPSSCGQPGCAPG